MAPDPRVRRKRGWGAEPRPGRAFEPGVVEQQQQGWTESEPSGLAPGSGTVRLFPRTLKAAAVSPGWRQGEEAAEGCGPRGTHTSLRYAEEMKTNNNIVLITSQHSHAVAHTPTAFATSCGGFR